jgi:hypothetical protein
MTDSNTREELREELSDLPFQNGGGWNNTLGANIDPIYFDKLLDFIYLYTQRKEIEARLQLHKEPKES